MLSVLSHCCCTDRVERNYLVIDPFSEEPQAPSQFPALGKDPRAKASPRLPEPVSQPPSSGGADGSSSSGSVAERLEENARLQELVKSFARRAVQGIGCHFLEPGTGEAVAATYFVDRRLQSIRLQLAGGEERACELSDVQEVGSFAEDEQFVPPEVLAALDDEARERLLVLRHSGDLLVLLLGSVADRQTFQTCMRILQHYAQQQQKQEQQG